MSTLSTIHQRIKQELRQIEDQENVRLIYACESGSRAWGFPSQDSDYDVASSMCGPWTGTCPSGTAETSSSAR